MYQFVLGRTAAQGEVNNLVGLLPAAGQGAVIQGFLLSPEFQGNVIAELYNTLLHRVPSQGEINGWLSSGQSMFQLQQAFLQAGEFFNGP
jgi:hypothetical protein